MQAIFISYRREDASGHAGRLFDDLCERLGKRSVFMDVAGIQPGRDFRKVIHEQVGECGVLLAVIGPRWLEARDSGGRRRLDNPADYVRLETATALQRDIPVVPVLVNGAQMMQPEDLPPELADLAFRNAFEVRDTRWRPDIELLAVTLRAIQEGRSANDTMTLRPLAAMPPGAASEPSAPVPAAAPTPTLAPAAPPPARRAPPLWVGAGAGLALVGVAGAAFLALRPGTPPPAGPVPPERLAAASAAAIASATASAPSAVATPASPPALPQAASAPVALAAASASPAPASAAIALAAASGSAAQAASAPATLLAAASAATPPIALPVEPTAAGPAASGSADAPAAPTPTPAPPPPTQKSAAPVAAAKAPREPAVAVAGTNAGSTLTVTGWKVNLGGCGGPPVAVKGVATFTIEPAGRGVRVTQLLRIQDQGWNATITGEAHFDSPRPGRYELTNHGEWSHVQGRRFRTEARVAVISPDGLKAASARGIAIRTLCA